MSLTANIEHTAISYITTRINRKIARARDNKLPSATVDECLDQQSLITEYLLPSLDQAPCVLVHGDLTTENIIVDEEFNVKAYVLLSLLDILSHLTQNWHRIIDLGFAEMIPLQFSACFPNFLTYDFQSSNEPVEVEYGSGVDGQLVWRSKNTPMMRRDRTFYLQ
jgi:hypothetical protein